MDNLPNTPEQPLAAPNNSVTPGIPVQQAPLPVPPQSPDLTVASQPLPLSSKSHAKLLIIGLVVFVLILITIGVIVFFLRNQKQDTNSKDKSSQSAQTETKSTDNKAGTQVENNSSQQTSPAPAIQKEIGILYDVPKLMGKSRQEIIAILGEPNNGHGNWYNYDNNWSLTVYNDSDNGNFRYLSVDAYQDPNVHIFTEAEIYKAMNLTPNSTEYIFSNIRRTGQSYISQVDIYPLDTKEDIFRQ